MFYLNSTVGQLGLGHTTDMSLPTRVQFFDDNGLIVGQLRTGDAHTVALTCTNFHLLFVIAEVFTLLLVGGGKVYSWGSNTVGILPDST